METTPEKYRAYVRQKQKKSPLGKDMALAFLIGGLICVLGQLISDGYIAAGLPREEAATATSVSLVFLSALLTGLNLYHRLARYGNGRQDVPGGGACDRVRHPGQRRLRGYSVADRVKSRPCGRIWSEFTEKHRNNWHFSQKTGGKLYLS